VKELEITSSKTNSVYYNNYLFRVKNHDFTPKNHIFSIAEGGAKIFEVFRVKNHDFTPKNHIFSNAPPNLKSWIRP
jgi:hypothetical protein